MIKAIFSPLYVNKDLPSGLNRDELKKHLIIDVAQCCLVEIASASFLVGSAYPFAAHPIIGAELVAFTTTLVAFNIVLRCSAAVLKYRSSLLSQESINKKLYDRSAELIEWAMPFSFAMLYYVTGNTIIHESGHVLASLLLWNFNCGPRFFLESVFNARMVGNVGGFTSLGARLGPLNATIVHVAAGPLAGVLAASMAMVLALKFRASFPRTSQFLYVAAISSIFFQFTYALDALLRGLSNGGSHDYACLWHHGTHPLVCIGVMVAIPLISAIFYLKIQEKNKKGNL